MTSYQPVNVREQTVFDELWKRANPTGSARISGESAANFFRQSQLTDEVLKTIWGLTATTHDMDKDQFYSTLRLIAIAQENKKIHSLDQLSSREYSTIGLPAFTGVNVTVDNSPSRQDEILRGEYVPTDETERQAYDALWDVANPEHADTIVGNVAVDFLKDSMLGMDLLKEIWTISTPSNTLNKAQFFCALRLICMAQNGITEISKAELKRTANTPMRLPMFEGIVFAFDDAAVDIYGSPLEPSLVEAQAVATNTETDDVVVPAAPSSTIDRQSSTSTTKPDLNDPPFAIRTTINPDNSVNHSVNEHNDDVQKINMARSQLAESSADFARSSARVRNDSENLDRFNGFRNSLDGDSTSQSNFNARSRIISPLIRNDSNGYSSSPLNPIPSPKIQLSSLNPTPAQPAPLDRSASGSSDSGSTTITPLRSEISSLRGVLNTLTDHKATMANEIMVLQARSSEYANALSRAQSQLVEKESHVLYLQSKEALLLMEREALLREIAAMNDEIAKISKMMPSVEISMMELAVANQVADKWKEVDTKEVALKRSTDTLNMEVETLRSLLNGMRRDNDDAERRLQAYLSEVDRNTQQLAARENDIQKQTEALIEKEKEKNDLMAQVLAERAKLPILSAAIAAARAKLYDAQENSLFEAQMNVMDGQAESLNAAIAKICTEVSSLQGLLNTYLDDRVEMESELKRIENETVALADNVEDAVYWFQSPHHVIPSNASTQAAEPSVDSRETRLVAVIPDPEECTELVYEPLPMEQVSRTNGSNCDDGSSAALGIPAAAVTAADAPTESDKPANAALSPEDIADNGINITRLHARDNYVRSLSHPNELKHDTDVDVGHVKVHAMVNKIEEVIHHAPRPSLSPKNSSNADGPFLKRSSSAIADATATKASSYLAPSPAAVPSPARAITRPNSTNGEYLNGNGLSVNSDASEGDGMKTAKPIRQIGLKSPSDPSKLSL